MIDIVGKIREIKTDTGNITVSGIKKNTLLTNFQFEMISSTDHMTPKTGLGTGITAQRVIDSGSFSACANTPTEIANGMYSLDLSADDLNGNVITFMFSATGADTRFITIKTAS